MSEALSITAHSTLEECEAEMRQCRDTMRRDFRRFGILLQWIRDMKLYLQRDPSLTFDAYCQHEWDFSDSRARQIILASQAVEISVTDVTQISTASNEWQARKLLQEARQEPREFLDNSSTWEYPHKYTPEAELTPNEIETRDQYREQTILQAAKEIRLKRAEENRERLEAIKAQPVNVPTGKFQCIVVDPPWPMERIHRDLYPEKVGMDYPTMTEEELMTCPYVPDKAANDCHLYLWTTHRFLPMAFRLAEHWGFRYQCLMTWVKNEGMVPYSWMYSTEHVLFCRKGNLQLERLGMRLHFSAKERQQSRKPDEFYDLVRQASPGPRIDIFSREQREGFEQLGFAEEIIAFAGGE